VADPFADVDGWPRQLSWSDFQERSVRPPGVHENAEIRYDFPPGNFRLVRRGGDILIDPDSISVALEVDASETWVLRGGEDEPRTRTGSESEKLLRHEQGHFDLAGLAAAAMARRFRELRGSGASALQTDLHGAKEEIDEVCDDLQERYDHETEHGLDEQAQERWNRRIRRAIQEERPEEFY